MIGVQLKNLTSSLMALMMISFIVSFLLSNVQAVSINSVGDCPNGGVSCTLVFQCSEGEYF